MRIAMLCPGAVSATAGGAERLWSGIVRALNETTGHHADLVVVPSPERTFGEVIGSYAAMDQLDLAAYDLVVTGKYPAWMVRHPRHVVYLCHPLRGLYDAYPGSSAVDPGVLSGEGARLLRLLADLPTGRPGARDRVLDAAQELIGRTPDDHPDLRFPGPLARRVVHWLDRDALSPPRTTRWLAISRTVAARPGYLPPGIRAEVVVPPTSLDGLEPSEVGEGFFTVSRLDRPKRLDLLIAAMQHVPDRDARLRIAGDGPHRDEIARAARADDRITLLGLLADDEIVAEYAAARAVPFVPFDEDLGLVTLEAFGSGRAVVTCTDSGGVAEVVEDGRTGLVVPPHPRDLGAALTRLHRDPELAGRLGRAAAAAARGYRWSRVVAALLRPGVEPTPFRRHRARPGRPRVTALSTYPVDPPRHGGQVRVRRLLGALSETADVELVCLGSSADERQLSPSFTQVSRPASPSYHRAVGALSRLAAAPTGDIVATLFAETLPDLAAAAGRAVERSDVVVLCQPYLLPFVPAGVPVVYDAQNVEATLKATMYSPSATGTALAGAVGDVEAEAVRRALLVTAVSEEDLAALGRTAASAARFVLVPNGGDVGLGRYVAPSDRVARRDRFLKALRAASDVGDVTSVVLFVGSAHPPNLEAATRLVEAAAHLPSTLLVLAGSHVVDLHVPLGPNVVARGVIDDHELEFLLGACDVAANPMAAGSGTNLKMLDYFATGAPVVSSAVGARGFGLMAGIHYAETTGDDLAAVLARELADPAAGWRRAQTVRSVAAGFDWARVVAPFVASVGALLHG